MQTTAVLLYFISYIFFFAFNWKHIKEGSQRLINDDGNFTTKPKQLINAHLAGAIWLGIYSVIILKDTFLTILINPKTITTNTIILFLLSFTLILFLALKQSKSAYKKRELSSGNSVHLSSLFFCSYFASRTFFLFSYELWLRGVLLFETANSMGTLLAILINVFLYVLLHIFNSRKELLACIPFGITACLFCFLFNAVWPAIILHIGFSLAYEINFSHLNLIHLKNTTS